MVSPDRFGSSIVEIEQYFKSLQPMALDGRPRVWEACGLRGFPSRAGLDVSLKFGSDVWTFFKIVDS